MSMNGPHGPQARPIASVLDGSEALGRLTQRIRESALRLEAIRPLLPPALQVGVRAGPLDEGQWSLLVSSPAVAAKIRQLVPAIEKALAERGWQPTSIKVRVQAPGRV